MQELAKVGAGKLDEVVANVVADKSDGTARKYTERLRRNQDGNMRWGGNPIRVARTIARVLGAGHPGPRYTVSLESLLGAMAARLVPDGVLQYLIKKVASR